jgi:hypothetical protein
MSESAHDHARVLVAILAALVAAGMVGDSVRVVELVR